MVTKQNKNINKMFVFPIYEKESSTENCFVAVSEEGERYTIKSKLVQYDECVLRLDEYVIGNAIGDTMQLDVTKGEYVEGIDFNLKIAGARVTDKYASLYYGDNLYLFVEEPLPFGINAIFYQGATWLSMFINTVLSLKPHVLFINGMNIPSLQGIQMVYQDSELIKEMAETVQREWRPINTPTQVCEDAFVLHEIGQLKYLV